MLERKIESVCEIQVCSNKVERFESTSGENRTEHLDLKLTVLEALIMRQNEMNEKLNRKISEQNREIKKSRAIANFEKESKQSSC